MSDEYASAGFKGSLVNESMGTPVNSEAGSRGRLDTDTGNYPPIGDTTASGGYGSAQNPWSDKAQRGDIELPTQPQSRDVQSQAGLIDQSLSGGNLKNEIKDAKQGVDESTRRGVGQTGSSDSGAC